MRIDSVMCPSISSHSVILDKFPVPNVGTSAYNLLKSTETLIKPSSTDFLIKTASIT